MSDPRLLAEVRNAIDLYGGSAADALMVNLSPVPDGKFWIVLNSCVFASVSETRTIWASVITKTANAYPILAPVSATINFSGRFYPVLEQGFELVMFPGDFLRAYRDAATAGSSIYLAARYVELDLPLYHYDDPQRRNRMRRSAADFVEEIGPRGLRGEGRLIDRTTRERPTREG